MKSAKTISVASLATVTLLVLATPLIAQDIVGPRQGVALLRNGFVLRGQISQEGDHYVIATSPDSEIRLPRREVEVLADDLTQIFHYRRGRLPKGDADAQLDLARWALRHSLNDQAAEIMLSVARTHPRHPGVEEIDRRLRAAAQPTPAASTKKPNEPLTRDELADTARRVPPAAVASFTHKVQPLLLNHCASSGCHGLQAKSDFRLLRSPWQTTVTQQITQRNLHATIKQLNADEPADSPLVLFAGGPHGPMRQPVFGQQQQKHIDLLIAWATVAADGDSSRPATIPDPPGEPLLQSRPDIATANSRSGFPVQPAAAEVEAATNQKQPANDRPPPTQPAKSADPFDPRPFNDTVPANDGE